MTLRTLWNLTLGCQVAQFVECQTLELEVWGRNLCWAPGDEVRSHLTNTIRRVPYCRDQTAPWALTPNSLKNWNDISKHSPKKTTKKKQTKHRYWCKLRDDTLEQRWEISISHFVFMWRYSFKFFFFNFHGDQAVDSFSFWLKVAQVGSLTFTIHLLIWYRRLDLDTDIM